MARKNPTLPAKASARSASEARADLGRRAQRATRRAPRSVVPTRSRTRRPSRGGARGRGPRCGALAARARRRVSARPRCSSPRENRAPPAGDAAAAVSARVRSPDAAELLVRRGRHGRRPCARRCCGVTRSSEGRRVARDFGLGDPFSTRQPAHVARALTRILAALEVHREVRDDIGLLPEDMQTIPGLARDLGAIAGAPATVSDEQAQLLEAQGALRAFFDLFAAKASLALAGRSRRARACALSLLSTGGGTTTFCAASLPGPPAKVPFTASRVHGLMERNPEGTR